jgi:predicted regulator of Ras-like GTPase activity (Roadblock/LC7/MglB family)
MSLINRVFGADSVANMNSILHDFVNNSPHINSAVISTTDGFCIASSKAIDGSTEKLSAMSGSIHSLAKSISHEISGEDCEMLVLESKLKKIVWCTLKANSLTIIMAFISEDNKLLGELLFSAKQCCKLIQNTLNK